VPRQTTLATCHSGQGTSLERFLRLAPAASLRPDKPVMSDKTYIVRTYGCQMNEHDSERIAGLLEADGLRPAAGVDDADVVVLNTCCIRENADNKLYGHLGQLKAMKAERPDMQIVVGGCLAQKDRDLIVERAPHVDVVLGTHNVGRAAELLAEQRAAGRSLVEIMNRSPARCPPAARSRTRPG
jgi:tRNA-2-methylthio-N6-dimethylallyladenosine synthase